MGGTPSLGLTAPQASVLEKLLRAGFRLITLERFARYPGAERDGFVALLDLAGGKVKTFGEPGYRMGEGIGMLVEGREGKTFVWHGQTVPASPQLLELYDKFRAELRALLE